jgi:hypothetical protein
MESNPRDGQNLNQKRSTGVAKKRHRSKRADGPRGAEPRQPRKPLPPPDR